MRFILEITQIQSSAAGFDQRLAVRPSRCKLGSQETGWSAEDRSGNPIGRAQEPRVKMEPPAMEGPEDWVAFGRDILELEATSIRTAASRLDARFLEALDLLDRCVGKVVTTGVGASVVGSAVGACVVTRGVGSATGVTEPPEQAATSRTGRTRTGRMPPPCQTWSGKSGCHEVPEDVSQGFLAHQGYVGG